MYERDLVSLVERELKRHFGKALYLNKNHGTQFVTRGRPDLEGSIFGRHFGFELKAGSTFTRAQVIQLTRIHRAGGIAAGIVHIKGITYFLRLTHVVQFSLRDKNKWITIGDAKQIDFLFLYQYLHHFYTHYHGEGNV